MCGLGKYNLYLEIASILSDGSKGFKWAVHGHEPRKKSWEFIEMALKCQPLEFGLESIWGSLKFLQQGSL